MPKSWPQIESSPEYQSADIGTQQLFRFQYFDDVIAPQVPEDQQGEALGQFLTAPFQEPDGLQERTIQEWQQRFQQDPLKAETIETNPWVDPLQAFFAGFGAAGYTAKALGPGAVVVRGLTAGAVNALMDTPIGVFVDEAGKVDPKYTLPVSIGLGLLSGKLVEGRMEKAVLRGLRKLGVKTGGIVSENTADAVKKLKEMFTAFEGLDDATRQRFINLRESDPIWRQDAGKFAFNMTKRYSPEQLRALAMHLEQPQKFPMPEGLDDLGKQVVDLQRASFKALNKPFLSEDEFTELSKAVDVGVAPPKKLWPKLRVQFWPDNLVESLAEQERKLQVKIRDRERSLAWWQKRSDAGESKANEKIDQVAEELEGFAGDFRAIRKRRDELWRVKYLHRITSRPKGLEQRIVGRRRLRKITARPSGLIGRKEQFVTIEEVEKAGRTVRDLPAAVADTIYQTRRSLEVQKFIEAINQNPAFSSKSVGAPLDWVSVDERLFPAGKYKKYHPAIADALKEITFVDSAKGFAKLYDKLNTYGKIIGFYNPLIMTRYNVSQGYRAVGFDWFKSLPEAIKIYAEKGETYKYLQKNGLFNKMFDFGPTAADVADQLREQLNKPGISKQFREAAEKVLHPATFLRDIWEMLNKGTWKLDEMQRIATWKALKDNPRIAKNYDDFGVVELANDFHANYGKIPNEVRKQLNKLIFTPSYKISMARILGRMHTEAKALWPSLIRHYAMKLIFNKATPIAIGAYAAHKGWDKDKKARVEGFHVIISGPKEKKETVYSISDPSLEELKWLNRPVYRNVKYNLASIPAAIHEFIKEPHPWDSRESWLAAVNGYFKIGAPIVRELLLMQDDDLDSYQKMMQGFGFAFVYKRNKRPELEEPAIQATLRALGLWTDWKTLRGPVPPTPEEKKAAREKKRQGRIDILSQQPGYTRSQLSTMTNRQIGYRWGKYKRR